ncbi:MAG: thermonuclease family protein [Anaerolineae bacterium]
MPNRVLCSVATPRLVLIVGLVTIAMLVLAACGYNTSGRESARVVEIVDGDTIKVELNGQMYRLRYIGINAPEIDTTDGKPEPYALEAAEANRRLVEGQTITLEKDVSDTDRFGRLLRYVYVGDILVNAELVRLGLAWAKAYPPDTRLQTDLYAAENQAREAYRGVWSRP